MNPVLPKTIYHFILSGIMILCFTLNAQSQITFLEVLPEEGADFNEIGKDSPSIAFSDVDGDGDEDVLISGNFGITPQGPVPGFPKLYTNDDGTFTLVENTPFELIYASTLAFSDIDGDGDEDLLITGGNGNASDQTLAKLYSNDGGTFNLIEDTPFTGVIDGSIAFSDVDGDGDEDLFITGSNTTGGTVSANLYTNDGGSFNLIEDTPFVGVRYGDIAFADIDGDGDEDLLITGRNQSFSPVAELYSNDGGNFSLIEDTPFEAVSYSSAAFSDIDGDGDKDVLITGSNSMGQGSVGLYTNDGGNFTLVTGTPFSPGISGSVDFADVDGDGDEDVLITGRPSVFSGRTSLYSNEGGNFTLVPDDPFTDVSQSAAAFSDVDEDGDEDVLIVGRANVIIGYIAKLYRNTTDECIDPFPAVDESSLNTTFLGDSYLVEWDPVPGQIACQLQLLTADGEGIKRTTLFGDDVDSAVIPDFLLEPNTEYKWRVRCGCSVEPIIAGPFSSFQFFTTPGVPPMISSSPNPSEGQAFVNFTVVEEGYATLEVFDMSGRLVDVIFAGLAQPNADYRFEYDGSALPNGVYLYLLTTENEVVTEKFMIAR
ncbi:FG-GAP-like repeat-containing protein [Cryomorphaceae bacterium 1068]|nr:FG-GAP-like repeat-containing protein [Cryomorphaceae bacterium 1068]